MTTLYAIATALAFAFAVFIWYDKATQERT